MSRRRDRERAKEDRQEDPRGETEDRGNLRQVEVREGRSFLDLQEAFEELETRHKTTSELLKRTHDDLVTAVVGLDECKKKKDILTSCSAFLREVSDFSRRKSIGRIEDTVNSAMAQIFSPRDIKTKIEFDLKGGRVGANVWLTNGENLEKIENRGGGIRDFVSVLLRVMFKKMSHPQLEGPIVLDESIKFLHSIEKDRSYVTRAYKFLKEISESLGIQFILVTNNMDVQSSQDIIDSIDKLFTVKLTQGVSSIKEVYNAGEEKVYG